MADFRRVATALAVVVLLMGFASTASAQQAPPPPFVCNTSVAVPPALRAEGLTELVGDIVLTCTGGTFIEDGQNVPVANFTVFLGANVTSRLLGTDNVSNASEALLLIDEPGTGTTGARPFVVAESPRFGCPGAAVGPCVAPGPNVYHGLVSGNSVSFIGVPINPPGTNTQRVFRITNVRVNASVIGSGTGGIPGTVQAFISITGPTSVPLNNPTPIVGFVTPGLTTSVASARTLRQCEKVTRDTTSVNLRFDETFATAFKPRVATDSGGNPDQAVPGTIYNTESGLVLNVGGSTLAGLADFGTRLRATFNNIPNGMRVFVSAANARNVPGTPPYAKLTALSNAGSLGAFSDAFDGQVEVPLDANGNGVAVWEVRDASPQASEQFVFTVQFEADSDPGNNIPALGTGTVAMSFAPAPPAFNLTPASSASATWPIPRFVDTGVPRNLVTVTACRTNLLFPFVTNQAGFDTGLAIANTSADPFGTRPQTGTCTWNYFGANAPDPIETAPVAGGTVTVALASADAPNFQGYVIAVCNFEFAHGYAFVSDVGARNLAMGYLALVLPEPARQRQGIPLAQGVFGEVLGQ